MIPFLDSSTIVVLARRIFKIAKRSKIDVTKQKYRDADDNVPEKVVQESSVRGHIVDRACLF